MATALQQQLAAISAKSTDQLNLKAQKQRHAKSLLFEPREAAGQSFDTLYQICYEGFDDLCQLDIRFRVFERNLFAPTSVEVEREHLSAQENSDLDAVIEQYLGLVCGRLLLRPAQKSVEWLVRRWKVHEHNTATLLLAFLPYHGHDIFPTILSILPQQLPPVLNFLRPYVAALQCPPRHAIVAAAVNKFALVSDLSNFVLSSARRRHHSSALIGFWASVTAQAVSGLLDNSQSGRPQVRQQKTEDILLRILPILQDALSIKGVSELYMASCMIMTILATKAQLDDHVLDAMMEAVASTWASETLEDGLLCLAVLAEEKASVEQPQVVTDRVLKNEDAVDTLGRLSESHRCGKLCLALLLGNLASKSKDHATLARLCNVVCLNRQHSRFLSNELVKGLGDDSTPDARKRSQQTLLQQMSNDPASSVDVQNAVEGAGLDIEKMGLTTKAVPEFAQLPIDEPEEMEGIKVETIDFEKVVRELPELPAKPSSFVGPEGQQLAVPYISAFDTAASDQAYLNHLMQLPTLHKSKAAERPELLTFLAAVWTTSRSHSARAKALSLASEAISNLSGVDCQTLLPYMISALADPNRLVRQAAGRLVVVVAESSKRGEKAADQDIWCKSTIYGKQSAQIQHLSGQEAARLVMSAILPVLEDCVLDATSITRFIAEQVNGSDLKASLRANACNFLASHAVLTSITQTQLMLLNVLAHVGKTASHARSKVVVPYVDQLESLAISSETTLALQAAVKCLSHRTTEELECLQRTAQSGLPDASGWALKRIGELFRSMKPQAQSSVAGFLLDASAMPEPNDAPNQEARVAASLEALRSLSLSGDALAHVLDNVPSVTSLQDQERPAKRQRTSKATPEKSKPIDMIKANAALRKLTIVLELVESTTSRPRVDPLPQLLKGLFNLLSELHRWKAMIDSDLVYVQSLLLSDLLGVVSSLGTSTASSIDRSVIRTDLIVETLRSTSSPQVHNTALLLISKLATLVPDTVLHSVMPLFTFMSSNTLRQADQYSSHVVNMTVESIVPPLAASLRKRGRDLVAGAAELLLSFTAAFEHMPLHRRLNTFQHLVQTLGPEEVLFAVVAMLVERYQDDNTLSGFVRELCSGCTVSTQLNATIQYLDLVVDACKPKRPLADSILGFGEKNAEQIHASVANLLEGLPMVLGSPSLRKGLAAEMQRNTDSAEKLRASYGQILERIVSLPRLALPKGSVNVQDPRITNANDRVLQALLGLMPTEDFITSSASLMQTGSEQVRTRVFASLTERVGAAKQGNTALRTVFIDALPNCTAFLVPSQPVSVRHAALNCIDGICEKYGKLDRIACSYAAEAVTGSAALESDNQTLRIAAVLCLASMMENLGEEMLGLVPKILNRTLGFVEVGTGCSTEMRDAVFSLINAMLYTMPFVLSARYLDRAVVAAAKCEEIGVDTPFVLEQFSGLASKKIAFHELVGSLDRTWDSLLQHGFSGVGFSIELLHQAIKTHSKATVTRYAAGIFPVMLKAFDVRRTIPGPSGDPEASQEETTITEDATQTALDMALKLNDTTFRPFFIRLVSWASDELPRTDILGRARRGAALYEFANRLFDQLGSIVTSYASFILDHTTAVMSAQARNAAVGYEVDLELALVLRTLQSSFASDQDDFWTAPQHFTTISQPLVDLLSASAAPPERSLATTITELASAVSGSDHLKTLNGLIMQHLRRGDAATRLEGVSVERAVTKRLTFDWLAMLPEMLPLISELLEDDDEGVERETLAWVREIEEVTGESLEVLAGRRRDTEHAQDTTFWLPKMLLAIVAFPGSSDLKMVITEMGTRSVRPSTVKTSTTTCTYLPSRRGLSGRHPQQFQPSTAQPYASPPSPLSSAVRATPATLPVSANIKATHAFTVAERSHLTELYYSHFHCSHPMLVPRVLFQSQQYPDFLVNVVCLVGHHFASSKPSQALLSTVVSNVTSAEGASRIHLIQAFVLLALVFLGSHEMSRASECLGRATLLAGEARVDELESSHLYSRSTAMERETTRRAWWELYTVDGLVALLESRPPRLATQNPGALPSAPCTDAFYELGELDGPQPTYADFERRSFAQERRAFSSHFYRIEASNIVRRVRPLFTRDDSSPQELEAVSNTIASWPHLLPDSLVSFSGWPDSDLILLQAHLLVQVASVFLHFPRSNLPSSAPSAMDVSCIKKGPPGMERSAQHTLMSLAASKELCGIAAMPSLQDHHSPIYICGFMLGSAVQLSVASMSQAVSSQEKQQSRHRVVLMLGLLRSSGKVWPAAQTVLHHVQPFANSVFTAPSCGQTAHQGTHNDDAAASADGISATLPQEDSRDHYQSHSAADWVSQDLALDMNWFEFFQATDPSGTFEASDTV